MTAAPAISKRPDRARARPRPPGTWLPSTSVERTDGPRGRARLSARLRRVLTDNPRASHFTVHHIVSALGSDGIADSVALFSAGEVFNVPHLGDISGPLATAYGTKAALGHRDVRLPRALIKRKIPRSALALLIHGVSTSLERAEGVLRDRWAWAFHPAVSGAIGVLLFLLGLVSMAPIVGGGVQHAASAFIIALGVAERDGLVVMIGVVAGLACLAVTVFGLSSGRQLWAKVKTWLLQCARRLRLDALAHLLDRCCDGLGDLLRLRWTGLLLLLLSPAEDARRDAPSRDAPMSALRRRAQRVRSLSLRPLTT